jgi:hypothetical protein
MAHFRASIFSGILTTGFLTICGSEEMTVYGRGVKPTSQRLECTLISEKLSGKEGEPVPAYSIYSNPSI